MASSEPELIQLDASFGAAVRRQRTKTPCLKLCQPRDRPRKTRSLIHIPLTPPETKPNTARGAPLSWTLRIAPGGALNWKGKPVMSDVHILPAPILPDAWRDVDTSIDTEPPELLSEEQLERYADTVAALLRTAGMLVEITLLDAQVKVDITDPHSDLGAELTIDDDRSTEWRLTGENNLPAGTTAHHLARLIAAILTTATGPRPPAE